MSDSLEVSIEKEEGLKMTHGFLVQDHLRGYGGAVDEKGNPGAIVQRKEHEFHLECVQSEEPHDLLLEIMGHKALAFRKEVCVGDMNLGVMNMQITAVDEIVKEE